MTELQEKARKYIAKKRKYSSRRQHDEEQVVDWIVGFHLKNCNTLLTYNKK